METTKNENGERCGCGVKSAGGYWTGTCRRPKGHTGAHRQKATKADRLEAVQRVMSGGVQRALDAGLTKPGDVALCVRTDLAAAGFVIVYRGGK